MTKDQSTMKPKNDSDNVSQIRRITWIGIVVNLGLAIVKFIFGFLGSSQAVIADAVHSISDISTDFAVLFGVKFWSAPPDEDHPYGHRRIEALITAVIGLSLLIVAFGLGYKSLTTIRDDHIGQTAWIAILGPSLSMVSKEILYRWTVKIGNRVKSSAVVANAWHHRSDALSSVPAFVAVAVSATNTKWAFVDHIGALIISIFILKVSWDVIRPSLSELIDRGASAKDHLIIKKIARSIHGVKDVHALRTRRFGSNLHVDLHILVDAEISVYQGHNISEEVKKELIREGPNVLDVVVHLEPFESKK